MWCCVVHINKAIVIFIFPFYLVYYFTCMIFPILLLVQHVDWPATFVVVITTSRIACRANCEYHIYWVGRGRVVLYKLKFGIISVSA